MRFLRAIKRLEARGAAMNIIYYFSGTGNSLRAAQVVAKALGDCEILHINRLSALPAGCERVGFTFPNYALGVPDLVRRRLEAICFAQSIDPPFFGEYSNSKTRHCLIEETC